MKNHKKKFLVTAMIAMMLVLTTSALALSSNDFTRLYKFEGNRIDVVNGAGSNDILEGFSHDFVQGAFNGRGQGAYSGYDTIPINSEPVKTLSFFYKSSGNLCTSGFDDLFNTFTEADYIVVEGGYGVSNDECHLFLIDNNTNTAEYNLTDVGFIAGNLYHFTIVPDETNPQGSHVFIDGTEITGTGYSNFSNLFSTESSSTFQNHKDNNAVIDEIGLLNISANSSDATTLATTEYYPIPQILDFSVNDTNIDLGDGVEFCWNVSGSQYEHAINGVSAPYDSFTPLYGDVNCTTLYINQTETFAFFSTNDNGTAISTYAGIPDITVNVFNQCDLNQINTDRNITMDCEVSDLNFNGNYELNLNGNTLNLTSGNTGVNLNGNNANIRNGNINLPSATRVYDGGVYYNTITLTSVVLNTNAKLRNDWIGMHQIFDNLTYQPTIGTSFQGNDNVEIYNSLMNLAIDGRWANTNTPFYIENSTINYTGFAIALFEGIGDLKITNSNLSSENTLSDGIAFFGEGNCDIHDNNMNFENITNIAVFCGAGQNTSIGKYYNNNFNANHVGSGMIFGGLEPIDATPFVFQNNTFNATYMRWGISFGGHNAFIDGNTFNYDTESFEQHLFVKANHNNTFGNNTFPTDVRLGISGNNSHIELNGMTTGLVFVAETGITNLTINDAEVNELNLNYYNLSLNSRALVKVEFDTPITFTNVSIGETIAWENKRVYINDTNIPDVALATATLTFYETGFTDSAQFVILKDGVECTTCTGLFVNSTLVEFVVTGFSEYELGEVPSIVSFNATNNTVVEGDTTTLMWNVTNFTTLDLNGVNVTGLTEYNVSPVATTVYTLTASNGNVTANANLTVTTYSLFTGYEPEYSVDDVPNVVAESGVTFLQSIQSLAPLFVALLLVAGGIATVYYVRTGKFKIGK